VGFGGEAVAEEGFGFADVFGQGVGAVDSFVGQKAAAGDEVGEVVCGSGGAEGVAAEGDGGGQFQS
jgi:hypothetical protein